jgi:abortive infection bacteriophage resistance protein
MAKPFLSYQNQIDKLRNEKQLIISDTAYAEKVLERLIGHGRILQDSVIKK